MFRAPPHARRRLSIGLAFAAWLLSCAAAHAQPIPPLGICEGSPEWPPFTYFQRVGGQPTRELTGFSVDVISTILKKADIAFRIDLLPWRRCLREVAAGDHYQIALNATASPEREATYRLTRSYYQTTGHYFYSRQRHPDGLTVQSVADLKRYKVCGLLGFNYSMYGLTSKEVEQASGDHADMLRRLQAGRCDLFVEQVEVMAGYRVTGRDLLADPDLAHQGVPGLPGTPFHMLVSRNAPRSQALLTTLNAGLTELAQSHQLDRLWAQYVR